MANLDIYEKSREVPKTAQKEIVGGRMKGKTDINPMWRIKQLTELFGACGIGWYYKTTNKWIERHENEAAAFVDIELFIKVDGEWSMPISGTGGSSFLAKESTRVYMSDECYKMATTDAISVSCKQLGIGADIYWDADRTKYDNVNADPTKPAYQKPTNQKQPATKPQAPTEPTKPTVPDCSCEVCKLPFTDFILGGKEYTAGWAYAFAKKKGNGKALCNDCRKKAGL